MESWSHKTSALGLGWEPLRDHLVHPAPDPPHRRENSTLAHWCPASAGPGRAFRCRPGTGPWAHQPRLLGPSGPGLLFQEGFVFESYQGCCGLIVIDVPQGPKGQPGLDGASGLPGMKGEKVRGKWEGSNTREPPGPHREGSDL